MMDHHSARGWLTTSLLLGSSLASQQLVEPGVTRILGHSQRAVWFEKHGTVWVSDGTPGNAVDTGLLARTLSRSVDPLIVYEANRSHLVDHTGAVRSFTHPFGASDFDLGAATPTIWRIPSWVGTALTIEVRSLNPSTGSWGRWTASTPDYPGGQVVRTITRPDRCLVVIDRPIAGYTEVYDLLDRGAYIGGTVTGTAPPTGSWRGGVLIPHDMSGGFEWTVVEDFGPIWIVRVGNLYQVREDQPGFPWLKEYNSYEFAPLDGAAQPSHYNNSGALPPPGTVQRIVWCGSRPAFIGETNSGIWTTDDWGSHWVQPPSLQGYSRPTILHDDVDTALLAADHAAGVSLLHFDPAAMTATPVTTPFDRQPTESLPFGGGWLLDGSDQAEGRELWFTDGTTAGTRQLADLEPGAASSSPRDFRSLATGAVFLADAGGSTDLHVVRVGDYVSYRQSCPSSVGIPQLSATRPLFGRPWTITIDGLPPQTAGYLLFSTRDRRFGLNTLPLDLGFLGAPGCFLNIDISASAGTTELLLPSDRAGIASTVVGIPLDPAVLGWEFFNQYASLDAPPSRALRLTTTNAGRGVVGL